MATSAGTAVADRVAREIQDQVVRALQRKAPWGTGHAFDFARGQKLYASHLRAQGVYVGAHFDIARNRRTQAGSLNRNEKLVRGQAHEILDVADRNARGENVERTGNNDPQTDASGWDARGNRIDIQHKRLSNPTDYFGAFSKDIANDQFVVPEEHYDDVRRDLERRVGKGGAEAKRAKTILVGLRKGPRWTGGENPTREIAIKQANRLAVAARDTVDRAARRAAYETAVDIAVFAVGAVVTEYRLYRAAPEEMTAIERCRRVVAAIWTRLVESLKRSSGRELATEILYLILAALTAPLRMAAGAVRSVADTVRRLWMDFVDGKLETLADVVSAVLVAVLAVAAVGVATTLEAELGALLTGLPVVGELVAAVIAAALAGLMVALGAHAIEKVVHALFGIFAGAKEARRRREAIEQLCAEVVPELIADRDRLKQILDSHLGKIEDAMTATFVSLGDSDSQQDTGAFIDGLVALNAAYDAKLPWRNTTEFDERMADETWTLQL